MLNERFRGNCSCFGQLATHDDVRSRRLAGVHWCRLRPWVHWPSGRFQLSGSWRASCSLPKGMIRVVDLFEMILPGVRRRNRNRRRGVRWPICCMTQCLRRRQERRKCVEDYGMTR